ncbi:hypothetical protein QFC22_005091 [Naganishia vaughanmartiniae]|uniref:Uncharacterized protein n=1 Tax=Naganishia vaughanmartiniae TaxID=1424756 RepID=A0ACC2WWR8_9TREE|nr:hypothetical protein QFC22_005091 [Naganishia vaughanmartiniae]
MNVEAEMDLDVAPDLASQQWWDDNWVQPPNYWVIEKYHKYQETIRNDLGQRVVVTRERLLEVFVIVERKVMKCSTLYDLANVRVLGAMHSLSTALDRLRGNIPAPNVRETSFWQSQTIKVPEEQSLQQQVEKEMESMPGITGEDIRPTLPTTDESPQDQLPLAGPAPPTTAPGGKTKRKRPDPYQLTILHAMQTTQNSLQSLIDDPPPPVVSGNTAEQPTVDQYGAWGVKTREEAQAELLMRVISDANASRGGEGDARTSSGAGGGVKRAVDEAVRGMAKQARFNV